MLSIVFKSCFLSDRNFPIWSVSNVKGFQSAQLVIPHFGSKMVTTCGISSRDLLALGYTTTGATFWLAGSIWLQLFRCVRSNKGGLLGFLVNGIDCFGRNGHEWPKNQYQSRTCATEINEVVPQTSDTQSFLEHVDPVKKALGMGLVM